MSVTFNNTNFANPIFKINTRSVNPSNYYNKDLFTYIDISSIENNEIKNATDLPIKKAPSRARRLIKTGDVVLSGVRPYLKSFAVVKEKYDNCIASTGFFVIEKESKSIDPKYLLYYTLSDSFTEQTNNYMQGGSYPAINLETLKMIEIPLPFENGEISVREQKRIAYKIEELFSEIDKAIEKTRDLLNKAEVLYKTKLNEVFSKKPNRNWLKVKTEAVCKVFSGSSAPQDQKYFDKNGTPFVRVRDLSVNGKTTNLVTTNDKVSELAEKEKRLVFAKKGVILFPKSGAAILTNNRAILGKEAYIVGHLAGLEAKKDISSLYIYYAYCSKKMQDYVPNISYPSLNLSTIKGIELLVPYYNEKPDLAKQEIIAKQLYELEKLKDELRDRLEGQLDSLDLLKQSILNQAFQGKL